MSKGLYLIISGPAGVGKDTIACRLGGWLSVSATTRPPRKGEIPGKSYYYYSREEFEELIAAGEFMEYAEYNGNYYGTPKTPAQEHYNNGETVIFVIEVVGAAKIKKVFPEAVTVFLLPPSMEALRKRLEGRNTETPEDIDKRMLIAEKEIEVGRSTYDHVVVNDNIDSAKNKVCRIIKSEKLRKE